MSFFQITCKSLGGQTNKLLMLTKCLISIISRTFPQQEKNGKYCSRHLSNTLTKNKVTKSYVLTGTILYTKGFKGFNCVSVRVLLTTKYFILLKWSNLSKFRNFIRVVSECEQKGVNT